MRDSLIKSFCVFSIQWQSMHSKSIFPGYRIVSCVWWRIKECKAGSKNVASGVLEKSGFIYL